MIFAYFFQTSLTYNVLYHYAMTMNSLALSKHLIGFMKLQNANILIQY